MMGQHLQGMPLRKILSLCFGECCLTYTLPEKQIEHVKRVLNSQQSGVWVWGHFYLSWSREYGKPTRNSDDQPPYAHSAMYYIQDYEQDFSFYTFQRAFASVTSFIPSMTLKLARQVLLMRKQAQRANQVTSRLAGMTGFPDSSKLKTCRLKRLAMSRSQ